MEMYTIHLGRAGTDGFTSIEVKRALCSNLEEVKPRAIDALRTRGVQVGATRLQVTERDDKLLWEYP